MDLPAFRIFTLKLISTDEDIGAISFYSAVSAAAKGRRYIGVYCNGSTCNSLEATHPCTPSSSPLVNYKLQTETDAVMEWRDITHSGNACLYRLLCRACEATRDVKMREVSLQARITSAASAASPASLCRTLEYRVVHHNSLTGTPGSKYAINLLLKIRTDLKRFADSNR